MTKDEVLKLAVEAGAYSPDNPDDYAFSVEELYRFADLVVAAERAKVYAAQEDPCPGCRKGGVCRTPKCGRLKLPADHPFRFERPEQEPRNISERWNIERDGDDLLVCFNDHEKSEGCRYERYVPAKAQPEQEPIPSIKKLRIDVPNQVLYNAPPVSASDTSQERVDETAKQRHEPVIDKSAAVRIATSLGWTPQRTWVGLTDEEIHGVIRAGEYDSMEEFARAIEAKLKSKNT